MEARDWLRAKFTRRENIHMGLTVASVICAMAAGMASISVTGDAWLDDIIRLAIIGAALIAVLTVAVRLFGDAESMKLLKESMKLLKEIRNAQIENHKEAMAKMDKTNHLLETYLPAIAKALGAKIPSSETGGSGGGSGGGDNDDKSDTII